MNRHSRRRLHRQLEAYLAFWCEVEREPQATALREDSWSGQPWKQDTTGTTRRGGAGLDDH